MTTAHGQKRAAGGRGDPYFANVSLLLHMNGSDGATSFPDSSLNNLTVTAHGNAQIDTAQSQFGGASYLGDGNGDYLALPSNAVLLFDADFTLEYWGRSAAWGTSKVMIYGGANFSIEVGNPGTNMTVWDGTLRTLGAIPATGAWHHIALTRSGTTLQAWLNGSAYGSSWTNSSGTSFTMSGGRIGQHGSAGASTSFSGWLDELRATKGVARYTGAFSAPVNPFPDN